MEKIFDLKLHEVCSIGCIDVMRVSGGWLYLSFNGQTGEIISTVFVPYCEELKPE